MPDRDVHLEAWPRRDVPYWQQLLLDAACAAGMRSLDRKRRDEVDEEVAYCKRHCNVDLMHVEGSHSAWLSLRRRAKLDLQDPL